MYSQEVIYYISLAQNETTLGLDLNIIYRIISKGFGMLYKINNGSRYVVMSEV